MVGEGDWPGSGWHMVVATKYQDSDHFCVLEQDCGFHVPHNVLIHMQANESLLDDFVMPFGSLSCSIQ